ncbi:putative deoxyribonuclease TATDN2 [Gastrophryne carolinensis]
MADRSVSALRKHKWSSPSEVSPNKFLRGNEAKLPRRVNYNQESDLESPSPPSERHVTIHPSESTPKPQPHLSLEAPSPMARARRRGHLRAHSLNFSGSAQTALPAVTPRQSVSLGEDDHRLEVKEDSKTADGDDLPRSRTQQLLCSSMLYKKAFNGILGFPARGRSLDSQTTRQQEAKPKARSLPTKQEPKVTKLPSALGSTEREIVPQRSSQRTENAGYTAGLSIAQPPISQALAAESEKTKAYVFLGESDNESDHGDSPKKDSSVGSDFSDIEDVSMLARFSQEDLPSPVSPVPDNRSCTPSSSSSGYVMYPCHLYGSPWNRCKELWPSSPVYKPSTEQNTWRQDTHNSSCVSEVSVNLECSHDASSDSDDAIDKSPFISAREQQESSGIPWARYRTSKNIKRTLEVAPAADYGTPKFLDNCFIDTHCHLDFLFSRLQHKVSSFADLREQYVTTFPAEFQGCIADYCDPRTLRRLPWQQVLNEDLVWGAFGCHPHFAQYYDDMQEEEMMQALRHPKAIAFGEMGLDYSHKCFTRIPDQHVVFEKQLKLAVALGKPLVIHCRGADDDLLKIMKKWVPRDYKIHRHCFTGSYEEIEPFLNEFPNMAVGFTAVLTYPSAENARETVSRIPLDRLIVETDAPFFLPRQVPKSVCKFSHPGLALHTIQEIARIKDLPTKSVMAKLRENTLRLYNI